LSKRILDLVEKIKIYSEKTLLRDVISEIEQGSYIGVDCGGDVKLLTPEVCASYPLTRSLGDLPLISPLKISPDLQIEDALEIFENKKKDRALLVKKEKVLGLVLKKKVVERVLKEIEEKRKIETYVQSTLEKSSSFILEIFPSKKGRFLPEEVKIVGPVEKITGYPARVFLSHPLFFFSRIHPHDRQKIENIRERLLKKGVPQSTFYRFFRSNGEWIYLQENIYPVKDEKGNVRSFRIFVTDVSFSFQEQKKKELLINLQKTLLEGRPEKALERALSCLGKESLFLDCGACFFWKSKMGLFKIISKWVDERLEEKFERMILEFSKEASQRRLKTKKFALDFVINKKKPSYTEDTGKSPFYDDKILSKFGWKSRYILPLILRTDLNTFLVLLSQKTSAFSEKDLSFFEELSPIFSAVVDSFIYQEELKELNLSLEEKVRQRTLELQVLYELSQKIELTLNYDELFREMFRHLARVVEYDVGCVLLLDDNIKELVIYSLRELQSRVKEKIKEHMFETAILISGKVLEESDFAVRLVQPQEIKRNPPVKKLESLFQVPLMLRGKKLAGIFFVGAERENAFSESNVRLFNTVGYHLSTSIDRIHSFLVEEQKRRESLVEHLSEGIILLDDKGYILLVNPKAREYLSYLTSEKEVGEKVTHLGGFALHQLQQRPGEAREINIEKPEHRVFEVEAAKIEINPEAKHILVTIRDVTEQRLTEEKIRSALTGTIHALVSAIESRDPYTAGHQRKVAEIARAIAEQMGLPKERIQAIYIAGFVHDIGKISVPAEILSRPAPLSKIEFSLIQQHPRIGYEILKQINFPWPIAEIVLQHHERLDGSGYPQGLKNDEILLEARILAVADVVEAMSSHRPYREALGIEKALEEIEKNRGKLYDPQVVDACARLLKEKGFKFE